MAKHFDVVVLGAGLGALTAAALLARRSWRVLVVGHGHLPSTYSFDGMTLARRPFAFLSASSPAWARVVGELAQTQAWKRRVVPLDPMFQVLGPRLRLDVPPDSALFGKEIDREMPGARRAIEAFYASVAETNAAADATFERDIVFPPGGFWERREMARLALSLPQLDADSASDFVPELPQNHPFRRVVETPARFASHVGTRLPAFALARLHGAWARGVSSLAGGEDELSELLLERVRSHGGETKLADRVSAIVTSRDRVAGVRVDGDDELTGVQFLVSNLEARRVLELAEDFSPKRAVMEALPQLAARAHRFVVTLIVRTAGLPSALGAEAFLLPSEGDRPVVHLHRHASAAPPDHALLVAEILRSDTGEPSDARSREAVLSVVEEHLPFVERHYVVVDSPHDGRPLWDYRSGRRVLVDRAQLRSGGGSATAEPMTPQWEVAPPTFHGLAGEPIRMPLGGAYAVGPAVLPALGQEGELLAAWGAARLITRTDRRKERMRREMWSKIEIR